MTHRPFLLYYEDLHQMEPVCQSSGFLPFRLTAYNYDKTG